MHHPRRILRRTGPLKPTSSLSSISKCSTASHVEFTPELSRSEETRREEADSLLRESKEMPPARSSETRRRNDHVLTQNILYQCHPLLIRLFILITNPHVYQIDLKNLSIFTIPLFPCRTLLLGILNQPLWRAAYHSYSQTRDSSQSTFFTTRNAVIIERFEFFRFAAPYGATEQMTGETKAAYFEEVAPAASTGIALTHFLNIEIRILSICFIAWIISHLEMFGDYYNFLLVG